MRPADIFERMLYWLLAFVAIGSTAAALLICVAYSESARAAPPPPLLTLSVIIDRDIVDEKGEPAARLLVNDMMNRVSNIYHDQIGLDVRITYTEISHLADDTQPLFLLQKIGLARMQDPLLYASDATVFLTERMLAIGPSEYYGYASAYNVCEADTTLVVSLQDIPERDSEVIAHEIGHLLGAPHDGAGQCAATPPTGYLMQAVGLDSSQFSQCSIRIIKAVVQSTACLNPIPPPRIKKSGAFDATMLLVLSVFYVAWWIARIYRK